MYNKIAIIITIIIMYAAPKSFSLKSMFGSQNENNICTYVLWSVFFYCVQYYACIRMKWKWCERETTFSFRLMCSRPSRFKCKNMPTYIFVVFQANRKKSLIFWCCLQNNCILNMIFRSNNSATIFTSRMRR